MPIHAASTDDVQQKLAEMLIETNSLKVMFPNCKSAEYRNRLIYQLAESTFASNMLFKHSQHNQMQ